MNLHAIDDGRGLLMPMAGDGGVRCSGSRSCGAGLEGCAGCARVEAECWKARGCTVAIGARRELSSRVVVERW